MVKLDLGGDWTLRDLADDKLYIAKVPESNYSALIREGVLPDPFVGMNEKDSYWVAERDWEYSNTFVLDEDLFEDKDLIVLKCGMLDTLAEIYVNGKEVAKTFNAHIGYEFIINDYVNRTGENLIGIIFRSPARYIAEKQAKDKSPNASMGVDGVPHIRKPQCHFGWDWGPILPPSGIMGEISVAGYKTARIHDFEILQKHHGGKVTVSVAPHIKAVTEKGAEGVKVTCVLRHPSGKEDTAEYTVTAKDDENIHGMNKTVFDFEVASPELWYTNDLNGREVQPLYEVSVFLTENNKRIDRLSKKTGLRTVRLNRESDKFGKNFCFEVNGTPIFAKGANWIPADSFIDRFTPEKCEYFIKSCRDAGMNMIRVWGGGYYESETFYDLCDKYGILVWQDFAFACAPYPFYDKEFLENVKNEIEFNVKRLRHRASLALWCGNNEIEMMTIGWRTRAEYVKWTEIFFRKILPEMMSTLDPVTPFIPGSPTSSYGFLKKVNCDEDGDTHLWHVWHGLQPLNYYRKRYTRFCSEFGLESLPDMKTVEYFAKPEDYSLKSPVFMSHQKCTSGNMKMLFYASTRFRVPKSFEDTVYLTQIIQSICVEDATEHWRRNKGRCNGSLYWQLNDCWPVSSWSGIDFFGRQKALQYRAKHFNAPVTVSLLDDKTKIDFFVINDTLKDEEVTLRWKLTDFEGNVLKAGEKPVTAPKLSSSNAHSYDFAYELKPVKKNAVLCAWLISSDNSILAEKTVLFAPEKKLNLPKVKIRKEVQVRGDTAYITLESDKYARFAWLALPYGCKPFSDNCFDLLPGQKKTVTVPADGRTAEEIKSGLTVKTASDVVPKSGALGDAWMRFKIRLVPINIGNWIYYHFT